MRLPAGVLAVILGVMPPPGPAAAQATPPDLARERADYSDWLAHAPDSPLAAIARLPIGAGIRLGPAEADVPLDGVPEHRIGEENGRVTLAGPEGSRLLPRGRPVRLGGYAVAAGGDPGRMVITVFRPSGERKPPEYYPYDPALVFEGTLAPPAGRTRTRVLAADGTETEAVEAGTVSVPVGGGKARLRVLRLAGPGGEESELVVYFRDGTNGEGTYPAGRFVSLVPVGEGRYRLDFNRARNPFCAYSTAYPCPAPWRGNGIAAAVRAGERYQGGGLATPPAGTEVR